ncbi:MAG: hypothetical protein RJQ04_04110 [Longimicrobiales bacterium]
MPPADIVVKRPGPRPFPRVGFALDTNKYILGAYDRKELDVVLWTDTSGPLLGISLKASMSGLAKNINNRWEEMVGDAANLHSRFPMLSLGYFMVLPFVTPNGERVIGKNGRPTELGMTFVRKLRGVGHRVSPTDLVSEYEHVALAAIDFDRDVPRLHRRFPARQSGVRVEDFFDRLVQTFRGRNEYLG